MHTTEALSGRISPRSSYRCVDPIRKPPFPDRPCRKCANCLSYRQFIWSARAACEMVHSHTTAFVTLTFRPDLWSAPEPELYEEFKKYVKRLRSAAPKSETTGRRLDLRFLCTFERGSENGSPHYHTLLSSSDKCPGAFFRSRWKQGHTHCRIVWRNRKLFKARNIRVATEYCTKYGTKDAGRFRASNGYGSSRAPLIFMREWEDDDGNFHSENRAQAFVDQMARSFGEISDPVVRAGGVRLPRKLQSAVCQKPQHEYLMSANELSRFRLAEGLEVPQYTSTQGPEYRALLNSGYWD